MDDVVDVIQENRTLESLIVDYFVLRTPDYQTFDWSQVNAFLALLGQARDNLIVAANAAHPIDVDAISEQYDRAVVKDALEPDR